jgi:hypothetical protein
MKYLKINEIKLNPNNPRIIKDDKFTKLVQSIKDFPEMLDIRPIVVNQDMIILGGNMRYKACKEAGLKEIPVIVTDLTEEQQREFLIKDNTSGGEWDFEMLEESWDVEQLDEWMLDMPIDEKIDKLKENETLEFEQSVQLVPPKEYIIIMAEPNSEEWEDIKELLKLKMVRRGGYKEGSAFDAVGLERVLNWNDFKERYVNSSTK